METSELKSIIEAMIFVAEEPLDEQSIATALAPEGVEKSAIREALAALEGEWNGNQSRGIDIVAVAGGYQFRTKAPMAAWLQRLSLPKPMKLSAPALETLAIVAYRQPIVRSEVERIRGVDSGGVLKTLLERRLLRIVGRQEEAGQPLLYGTTKEFLEIFNLNTLTELPTLKDIEDLMRERRAMTESRVRAAAGGDETAEDSTDTIHRDDDEDETEVIRHRPLEDDEEDEKRDMEVLSELEESIKGVRSLEKSIFPKVPAEVGSAVPGENNAGADAEGKISEAGPAGPLGKIAGEDSEAERAKADAAATHAACSDDRPFE